MRKFALILKELRLEKKMSMRKLGEETGLSKSSISRWEKGISDIKSDELIKLSIYFNVSVEFLLGLKDY